jgi:hypothetical protein
VARDAEGILQSDPGVLGRHAPDVVVAKLTEGWITIKRAAVRGQPRTVEVCLCVYVCMGRRCGGCGAWWRCVYAYVYMCICI